MSSRRKKNTVFQGFYPWSPTRTLPWTRCRAYSISRPSPAFYNIRKLGLCSKTNPWNSEFTIFHVGKQLPTWIGLFGSQSAISNMKSANIFLSQIDFIKVLTRDVVLVSTLVNPKHKVNLTSHFLWAVRKYLCSVKMYHACLFFFTCGCKYGN